MWHSTTSQFTSDSINSFKFAVLADPQIGMSTSGPADARSVTNEATAFHAISQLIDYGKLNFSFIAGDLQDAWANFDNDKAMDGNRQDRWNVTAGKQRAEVLTEIESIAKSTTVILTPGNHDIADATGKIESAYIDNWEKLGRKSC